MSMTADDSLHQPAAALIKTPAIRHSDAWLINTWAYRYGHEFTRSTIWTSKHRSKLHTSAMFAKHFATTITPDTSTDLTG